MASPTRVAQAKGDRLDLCPAEQIKGFSLWVLRAVISGRGDEVIDVAVALGRVLIIDRVRLAPRARQTQTCQYRRDGPRADSRIAITKSTQSITSSVRVSPDKEKQE
jgi:hypothetical protein